MKKVMSVNLSKPADYYSQRNNKVHPISTCNTTSMVNALACLGILPAVPAGEQPEDVLTRITEQDKYKRMVRELYGKGAEVMPRIYHPILACATNEFVGREVVHYTKKSSLPAMAKEILTGRPVVVSGVFTSYGHVVCLVGVQVYEEALTAPVLLPEHILNFIVDDPFGDWHSDYHSTKGNDILFTWDEMHKLVRDPTREAKWGHFFDAPPVKPIITEVKP